MRVPSTVIEEPFASVTFLSMKPRAFRLFPSTSLTSVLKSSDPPFVSPM